MKLKLENQNFKKTKTQQITQNKNCLPKTWASISSVLRWCQLDNFRTCWPHFWRVGCWPRTSWGTRQKVLLTPSPPRGSSGRNPCRGWPGRPRPDPRSCPRTWLSGWEECCGCKDPETSSAWQNIYHLSISRLSFVRLPFRWEQYRGLRSVPGQRYNMTCLCFLYTIDGSLSCQIRPYPSLVSSQSLSAKIIILRRYMSEIASFQRKLVSISKTEVPTSFNQKSIKVCRTKIISQY